MRNPQCSESAHHNIMKTLFFPIRKFLSSGTSATRRCRVAVVLVIALLSFFSNSNAQTAQEKAAFEQANQRLLLALGPEFITKLEAGLKSGDGESLRKLVSEGQKKVVQTYGADSVEGAALVLLSTVWGAMGGESAESRDQIEKSIDIFESKLGKNNIAVAAGYMILGGTALIDGRLDEADRAARSHLEILENLHGKDSEEVTVALNSMATVAGARGNLEEANEYIERASAIINRTGKSESEQGATILRSRASLSEVAGRYSTAEAEYLKALEILRNTVGTSDLRYTAAEGAIGDLYLTIGDYEKAEKMLVKALESTRQMFGENSKVEVANLRSLVSLRIKQGRFQEALDNARQVLDLSRDLYGARSQQVAVALAGVAWAELENGNATGARELCVEGLQILDEIDAPDSVRASLLTFSGDAAQKEGNYEKALRDHSEALSLMEKLHGPQNDMVSGYVLDLATSTYLSGNSTEARVLTSRALGVSQRRLQDVLQMDERARLSWQGKMKRDLPLSCLRPEQIGQLLLRTKGVVLDSILEDRALVAGANASEEARDEYRELKNLKKEVTRLMFGNEDVRSKANLAELTKRVAELERSLGSRSNALGRIRKTADITLDAVLPALVGGTVLLDFARFEDPALPEGQRACYGCVILAEDGSPQFVKVENAEAIDRAIDSLRAAVTDADNKSCEQSLAVLQEKLWKPISEKLPPNTTRLIIGPDAELNFCPFAALQDEQGVFLAERFNIAYIGSGRDLSREALKAEQKTFLVFGDPLFDSSQNPEPAATEELAMRSAEADVFGNVRLAPLPGTRKESEELLALAQASGWESGSFLSGDATEERLKGSDAPRILHLATHGFYLGSASATASADTRGMSVKETDASGKPRSESNQLDPMRASGLALTGAQQTLELWSQKKAPDPENDGVLTAEEVAGLDLNGTWLVALSACETGVGEARSGEGVFGLRRAFMMAGAENLLMTLWPVADDTTAQIMADFYKEALATGDAPGSLAKVQRDWLVKLREEKGLATAIREAGPFAMVMMTAPTHAPVELPPIAKTEAASEPAAVATEPPAGDEPAPESKSGWWPF
jgi:CHAT domain-containing protein